MRFGNGHIDYYSGYDLDTFFSIVPLQQRIPKLFVKLDLLNAAIFWQTNRERMKHNLRQFQYHKKLEQMSTLHSEQMREHNFFDHENKFNSRYRTLSDRLESVKDENFNGFMSYAENIADCPVIKANESFTYSFKNDIVHLYSMDGKEIFPFTYSEMAKTVVDAWMNSPGHRANILNSAYQYLGCGCVPYEKKGNGYSITYFKLTQNFGGELVPPSIIETVKQTFRTVFNPHGTDNSNNKVKSNALFGGWRQDKNVNNMSNTFWGPGETPDNGEEKTLCVFLLDNSGSMSGEKIQNLNDGMRDFYEDISHSNDLSGRLEVAVISFNTNVKREQEPCLIRKDMNPPVLYATGGTNMEDGIREAIKMIEERRNYYRSHNIAYKRMWIVMITDGESNVNNIKEQVKKEGSTEIPASEGGKRYFFQPVAVDDNANIDLLKSLASKKVMRLKEGNFSVFFEWLSSSFEMQMKLQPGEKMDLENPPGWGGEKDIDFI